MEFLVVEKGIFASTLQNFGLVVSLQRLGLAIPQKLSVGDISGVAWLVWNQVHCTPLKPFFDDLHGVTNSASSCHQWQLQNIAPCYC